MHVCISMHGTCFLLQILLFVIVFQVRRRHRLPRFLQQFHLHHTQFLTQWRQWRLGSVPSLCKGVLEIELPGVIRADSSNKIESFWFWWNVLERICCFLNASPNWKFTLWLTVLLEVSRQGEFPSNFTDGFHSQAITFSLFDPSLIF